MTVIYSSTTLETANSHRYFGFLYNVHFNSQNSSKHREIILE